MNIEIILFRVLAKHIIEDPNSAIAREKQIKSWSRKKKDELIIKFNAEVKDLYGEII